MIEIKQASLDDVAVVAELFEKYREFYRCEPAKEDSSVFIRERIQNNESVIYMAFDEGGMAVGFAQLYPLFSSTAMKKLWLLNDLYVNPDLRGQGFGKSLIEQAKQLAKETGARGLFLETEASNKSAQGLYEKMGFQLNGNYFYSIDL